MIEKTLTERFKELISTKSASVLDFSRLIGVAQTTLNSQLSSAKGISTSVILLTLDAFPDVSAEWLLRGKGEMIVASSQESTEKVNTEGLFGDVLLEFIRVVNKRLSNIDNNTASAVDKLQGLTEILSELRKTA
jgi:flagellar hook-basal body complex protein FliE